MKKISFLFFVFTLSLLSEGIMGQRKEVAKKEGGLVNCEISALGVNVLVEAEALPYKNYFYQALLSPNAPVNVDEFLVKRESWPRAWENKVTRKIIYNQEEGLISLLEVTQAPIVLRDLTGCLVLAWILFLWLILIKQDRDSFLLKFSIFIVLAISMFKAIISQLQVVGISLIVATVLSLLFLILERPIKEEYKNARAYRNDQAIFTVVYLIFTASFIGASISLFL